MNTVESCKLLKLATSAANVLLVELVGLEVYFIPLLLRSCI